MTTNNHLCVAAKTPRAARLGWMLGLAVLLFPLLAYPIDYYVGPTVAGDESCLTSASNNCLLATALGLVAGGDTIHMADGLYQGANSMLVPAQNLSGTANARITVQATNDGEVWLDGQGVREVVWFRGNDFWTITGINASDSGGTSTNGTVFQLTQGSDQNIIRRVCVWDAPITTNAVLFGITASTEGNLFEDICAFGNGRKGFSTSQAGNYTTTRRAFIQWRNSTNTGPKQSLSCFYNSYNHTVENVVLTWQQDIAAGQVDQPYGILAQDQLNYSQDRKAYCNIYGSIMYTPTGDDFDPQSQVFFTKTDEIHLTDVISLVASDQTKQAFSLNQCLTAVSGGSVCSGTNMTIDDSTSINSSGDTMSGHWVQTNVATGANVAAVYGAESLWVNDGSKGATVCYEYQDGILTSEPLFDNDGADNPIWPMNQRIIDAMTDAGYTPVNVTSTLESLFGAIPDDCMKSAPTPPAGNLTMTSPGAASVQDDSTIRLNWTSTEISGSGIVTCSETGGVNPKRIATIPDLADNTYTWTPANGPCNPSETMQVCVQNPSGSISSCSSNFTIPGEYLSWTGQ